MHAVCHVQGDLTGRFSAAFGVVGANPPCGHDMLHLGFMHAQEYEDNAL